MSLLGLQQAPVSVRVTYRVRGECSPQVYGVRVPIKMPPSPPFYSSQTAIVGLHLQKYVQGCKYLLGAAENHTGVSPFFFLARPRSSGALLSISSIHRPQMYTFR